MSLNLVVPGWKGLHQELSGIIYLSVISGPLSLPQSSNRASLRSGPLLVYSGQFALSHGQPGWSVSSVTAGGAGWEMPLTHPCGGSERMQKDAVSGWLLCAPCGRRTKSILGPQIGFSPSDRNEQLLTVSSGEGSQCRWSAPSTNLSPDVWPTFSSSKMTFLLLWWSRVKLRKVNNCMAIVFAMKIIWNSLAS